MTDQLFLSVWLDRPARPNRLRHFETLLRHFPFSQRKQPQSTVTIQAISTGEPPLLERALNGPFDLSEILPIFRDYGGDDIAVEVESWWDLWQFRDNDWALNPARVQIFCFGPDFDNGTEDLTRDQEDLRIDFGVDSHFLPSDNVFGGARLIESNIKSLLRLVHEIDNALPVSKRKLHTESGENFADRLQQTVTGEMQK